MAHDFKFLVLTSLVAILTGMANNVPPPAEIVVWQTHDINMQCQVNKSDYERVVWKKNSDLLAVGTVVFTRDSRVRLLGLGRLQIKRARVDDTATYSCQPGAIAPENGRFQFLVKVKEYSCPSLPAPRNGEVVFYPKSSDGHYKNGTIAVVTCHEGFALSGNGNRTCCDCFDGWEGDPATCLSQELVEFQRQLSDMEKKLEAKVMNSLALVVNKSLPATQPVLNDVKNSHEVLERYVQSELEKVDLKLQNLSQWLLEEGHKQDTLAHKFDQEMGKIKYKQAHSDKHANEQILALKVSLGALEKTAVAVNNRTSMTSLDPELITQIRKNVTDVEERTKEKLEELNFQLKTLDGKIEDTYYNLQNLFGNNSVTLLWETMQKHAVATKNLIRGQTVTEYYWLVHQIEAKIKKVQANTNWYASVQSSYFYSDIPGYRFRLVLYPNYEMSDHIGLFAGLVPGEFDTVLSWPFRHEFHLAIVSHDQQVADHVGLVQFPSSTCSQSNFDRPNKSDMPSACGFRHFFSHEQLTRHRDSYLTAGHLWVRIRIFD